MRKKIMNKKTLVIFAIILAALFIGTSMNPAMAKISKEERIEQLKKERIETEPPNQQQVPSLDQEQQVSSILEGGQTTKSIVSEKKEASQVLCASCVINKQELELNSISSSTEALSIKEASELLSITESELQEVLSAATSYLSSNLEEIEQISTVMKNMHEGQYNEMISQTVQQYEEKSISIEAAAEVMSRGIKGYEIPSAGIQAATAFGGMRTATYQDGAVSTTGTGGNCGLDDAGGNNPWWMAFWTALGALAGLILGGSVGAPGAGAVAGGAAGAAFAGGVACFAQGVMSGGQTAA